MDQSDIVVDVLGSDAYTRSLKRKSLRCKISRNPNWGNSGFFACFDRVSYSTLDGIIGPRFV